MIRPRVLLLGTTGIDKKQAMDNIANAYDRKPEWIRIDFEEDFLFNKKHEGLDCATFLDKNEIDQKTYWDKAWDRLQRYLEELDKSSTEYRGIMLSAHASYIRGHYGGRAFLQPQKVADTFDPDIIFTCICDVYDVWARTQGKARHNAVVGRPTLEQLILGRRGELLLGDLISRACKPNTKNLMLSAYHPVTSFVNAINHSDRKVIYLSFPISDPRRMIEKGNPEGMTLVNGFIQRALQFQRENAEFVIQCPLTIDELPLRAIYTNEAKRKACEVASDEVDEDGKAVPLLRFSRSDRWALTQFLLEDDPPLVSPPKGDTIDIPLQQVEDAAGNIHTDVTFRDYRYVDQADGLAIFNPIINPGRSALSRSVNSEIEHAHLKHIFVYQDPDIDTKGVVTARFGAPGTMDRAGSELRRNRYVNVQEMFTDIKNMMGRKDK